MFGYIVPYVPELKVRELETFRAYYCGLCRTLKDRYGRIGILNYDATFLYMVLESLEEAQPEAEAARCIVHPFAKRPVVRHLHADYAADINVLMAWAKAEDDREDEGGMRAGVRSGLLKRAYHRACGLRPDTAAHLERTQAALRCVEKENGSEIDEASHPYADLLGRVFADGYVLKSHILHDLGYNLGRWVYMIDALDDMEEDAGAGRFNVFVNRAAARGQTVEEVRRDARFTLFYTLSQAQQALSRLELHKNSGVLGNVIGLGLRQQTESVLAGRGKLGQQLRA